MRSIGTRAVIAAVTLVCLSVLVTAWLLDWYAAARQQDSERRLQAHLVGSVVSVVDSVDTLRIAVAKTPAGEAGALSVWLPDGRSIGVSLVPKPVAAEAANVGTSTIVETEDGDVYLLPVPTSAGQTAVVEVTMPTAGPFGGTGQRWPILIGVALVVGATAVYFVSRVHGRMASVARTLNDAAERLRPGEPDPALPDKAPLELIHIGQSLGSVSRRWAELLTDERKLMGDLSHRLRTPLTALRLDTEAVDDAVLSRRLRASLAVLEGEVNTAISVSVAPAERIGGTADVSQLVRDRMVFWSTLAADQERACEVRCTSEPTPVAIGADDLRSVVDSLLVNVFMHTPIGTPVWVQVAIHADWITVVVDDGGPGFGDPEAAMRRGSSGSGSTGIGLDIVRSCAEHAGGTVHIERSAAGGARVRLRLPEAGRHPDAEPRAWRLWSRQQPH